MTSPDPPVLFKALRMAADEGAEYVFCEITAHAIFFDKFYGIRSELCIFTNITQDHLDFFGSMEKYAAAKLGYFINGNVKIGIINADDKYGREIINSGKLCCVSYGIEQPSDVFAIEISHDKGLSFVANAFDDIMYIKTCLLGRINVYNLLAAVAAARLAGISPEKIENAARGLAPVEGRMNVICYEPKVIVDFAHTPDGVLQALTAVRETVNGRIIAVFGCGGNRDKLKRPIMAGIGVKYADVCVFTSDNPRDENPEDIIGDMIKGVGDSGNYIVIQDRINAIEFAVKLAGKDDCVLVCGKGGENYTEIKGARVPYSDKAVCAAALEKKKCRK
jgi:UDP-N-acetylmuramoyl-L-alanyl-D-glutamate--2,6-diaminopimelate ligase